MLAVWKELSLRSIAYCAQSIEWMHGCFLALSSKLKVPSRVSVPLKWDMSVIDVLQHLSRYLYTSEYIVINLYNFLNMIIQILAAL